MRKKLLIWLSIFLVIAIVIGGYRYKHNLERKEMVATATILSQEYIKKYYDREFILKSYEIIHPSISSTIFLDGYIRGHEDITISVTYDYRNKEVRGVGGPGWFIDSKKADTD